MTDITQYGQKAADQLATDTRRGLLAPADFTKLGKVLFGPNGELLIGPNATNGEFLWRDSTGRLHLRSTTAGIVVGASGNLNLSSNLYFDAVTGWNLFNTGLPGWVLSVSGTNLILNTVTAGANPRTLTQVGNFTPAALGLAMDPPRAHVWGNGTSQTVNNTTVTPILFNATITNSAGAGPAVPWSAGSPGRLTIPVNGIYEIGGSLTYANVGGGTARFAFLRINGAALKGGNAAPPSGTQNIRVAAHTVRNLSAGDYVELCAYQDSGGAISVVGSGEETAFHIQYMGQQ